MNAFFDIVRQMPAPFNMVVLIVAMGCVAGVIKSVAKQVRIFADNEADRRLRRDMVDSGLSADEAERIVTAKATQDYTPVCK